MFVLYVLYVICEVIYYLYSKHVTYKQLENIHYSELKSLIPYKTPFELYTYLLCYFTNEPDLNTFFTNAFFDKQTITIKNINNILSYCIITPNHNNNNMRLCQSFYINNIIKVIKPRLTILNDDTNTNTNWKSSIVMTNKLDIVHKPFAFYTFMYLIRRVFNFYMYTLGFTNIIDPATQLRVWIKHQPVATNKTPLVFIHGVGLGIVPYIGKIRKLSTDRTLIVPELPNMSYDLYKFPPPSNDTLVASLYNILIKQGIALIDIIGHSYGALILNIFQIRYPHMCNYKTYAEPMCFHIHQSSIANILYKLPSTRTYNILNYISWLFVFRDMYTQYIGKRGMFAEHGLLSNLDNKTHIILAKDDYIIPSYPIHKYITTYHPYVKITMVDGEHTTWIFI